MENKKNKESKESKESKKNVAKLNDDALEPVNGGTTISALPHALLDAEGNPVDIFLFAPDEVAEPLLGPEAEKSN